MCYMNKASVVRARIEPGLKDEAEAVLRQAGLEMSDAIRLFFRQVVRQGGLPFPVQADARQIAVLPAAVIEAPKRAQQRAERGAAARRERLFIAPEKARAARIRWPDADYER